MMAQTLQYLLRLACRTHRDQRGAIAPLSVFAIFMFTILMVQIVNVGRQSDDKLRMQNAADASAYSGATVLARGMNAIAFGNHMLCETFALTAYMREGRDRKSDRFIPEILDAWEAVGNRFASGTWTPMVSEKFKFMGEAIVAKVPIEREMVRNFSEMAFHQSRITLPLFEYILAGPDQTSYEGRTDSSLGGFIPRFQRAVLQSVPHMSSVASDEISIRYGARVQSQHRNQPLRSLLWSTSVAVVGQLDETNPVSRTLPAIDPSRYANDLSQVDNVVIDCDTCFSCYECISRTQRQQWASHYLEDWIRHWISYYFEWPDDGSGYYGATSAKMSNLTNFWRVYTCANLRQLLDEEYPFTNLPFVLRDPPTFPDGCVRTAEHPERPCDPPQPLNQQTLEKNFNFVSSVYWPHQQPMFPGLFKNPLERDSQAYATAFAQSTIFLPRGQFTRHHPIENAPWVYLYPCPPDGTTCCSNLFNASPGDWDRFTLSSTNPGILVACPDDPLTRQPYNCSLPLFAYDARWERFGRWDMFSQNWTVKLVPATAENVATIVSQHPASYLNGGLQNYQPPPLQNVSQQTFHLVNGH